MYCTVSVRGLSDLVDFVIGHLVKRCGEGGHADAIVNELQKLCPRSPVDQWWLLVSVFEIFCEATLDTMAREFCTRAFGPIIPEWMGNSLARLRTEYHDNLVKMTNGGKRLTPGRDAKEGLDTGDGAPLRSEDVMEQSGRLTPPMPDVDVMS